LAAESSTEHVSVPAPVAREWPGRSLVREAGELAAFAWAALKALAQTPRHVSEVLRQTAILVRGSTLIIGAMSFLISYSVINFGYYVLRSISATDYLGVVSGIITPRSTTPLMFGYIFAAKVGCGMVAEIGAMKVNQEIEAYESEGVDPMRYVVATRLAAALLFLPVAAFVALVAGTGGDYFAAIPVLHGLSPSAFNTYHWGIQTWTDQFLSVACMAALAITIVIVSCFYGLRASSGPSSVGAAAARSLIVNLVAVHVIESSYVALVYGVNAKVPIGG
jgi:phospholipid/cholesterol/gamma-HCH transport system permease protein